MATAHPPEPIGPVIVQVQATTQANTLVDAAPALLVALVGLLAAAAREPHVDAEAIRFAQRAIAKAIGAPHSPF